MRSFLDRAFLLLAGSLYALTLADVSAEFTRLPWEFALAVGLSALAAALVLSRASSLPKNATALILLAASVLAMACRLGGYDTVLQRSEREWTIYRNQQGSAVAEEVSLRFRDLCRHANLAARTLAGAPALWRAVEMPESRAILAEAFRTLESAPLPRPLEEAVPGATLYDQWHDPLAWVGKNVDLRFYFETRQNAIDGHIFILERGVFTYLIAVEPLEQGEGSVTVEVPLAARRSLNNRYLSDYEVVTTWAGKSISTDYVDVREDAPELARLFDSSGDLYWGGTHGSPMLFFPLRSPEGELLGVSSLAGVDPSTALLEHRQATKRLAGGILALAALAIVVLLAKDLRRKVGALRAGSALTSAVLFGAALAGFRVVLLVSGVPLGFGTDADNPTHYGSSLFFDFFRSPVDFLVTTAVVLVCLSALFIPWISTGRVRGGARLGPMASLPIRCVSGASVLAILMLANHVVHDTWVNSNLPLALPGGARPYVPLLNVQMGLTFLFLAAGLTSFFLFSLAEQLVGGGGSSSFRGVLQVWALDGILFIAAYLVLDRITPDSGLLPSLLPFLTFHLLALKRKTILGGLADGALQRRSVTCLFLILVPVLSFYPALWYHEHRTTRAFMESTVAPSVTHHGGSQQYVLIETLQAIDRMVLAGRFSAPERADLAYQIWSGSDLSITALSSSVEVFDERGRLVSRFALNFPVLEWSSLAPDDSTVLESMAQGEWIIWRDPYPGEPDRPRILNARRLLAGKNETSWDIRVRLVADWSNLPFISTWNPYIDLFRAPGTEAPLPSPHTDLSLYVFDRDGDAVFRSSETVLRLEADTIEQVSQGPIWLDQTLRGEPYHILFFSDADYVFALAYVGKSTLSRAAEIVGWAILSVSLAAVLLLVGILIHALGGPSVVSTRDLWTGVGRSFYGKLFVALVLLALIPTVLLAVLSRGIVVRQLELEVEQEGVARAGVVQRFVREYVLLQTIEASERGVAAIDDAFLEYVGLLVDSDVDLYSRGELVASSKRELFSSGLLPTRAVPEVFREVVLEHANQSMHHQSVGSFEYLVVSVPIALERWGEPGILSIPLASRQREIDRRVASLNQKVLLAAIGFALVAGILAYSLARRIAEPINTLTEATRRVAQGDFDIVLSPPSEDEIGVLSRSFNQMTSDLKKQREDLERTKKLEAWAEMARQVAHEIKNPLTPIQLSTEHLIRVFGDRRVDFKKVLKGCTETILQQVRTLRHISMEFSTFANPTPIEPEPTNFASLVMQTVEPYRQAPPEGVTVGLDVSRRLPTVSVDRRLIQRTLVNLIENALHALNGRGRVEVAVRPVESDGRSWIEVDVTDDGEGIDRDLQEHIFEPYFSTRASGTGLGLAIARKAVEDHGGVISLESEPGRGTRVRIRLPAGW